MSNPSGFSAVNLNMHQCHSTSERRSNRNCLTLSFSKHSDNKTSLQTVKTKPNCNDMRFSAAVSIMLAMVTLLQIQSKSISHDEMVGDSI